jgi:hypothetical protein
MLLSAASASPDSSSAVRRSKKSAFQLPPWAAGSVASQARVADRRCQ